MDNTQLRIINLVFFLGFAIAYFLIIHKHRSSIAAGFYGAKLLPRINNNELKEYIENSTAEKYEILKNRTFSPSYPVFCRLAIVALGLLVAFASITMSDPEISGMYFAAFLLCVFVFIIVIANQINEKDDELIREYADMYTQFKLDQKKEKKEA